MQALLDFEEYFVEEQIIKINKSFQHDAEELRGETESGEALPLAIDFDIKEKSGDPDAYMLEMKIELNPEKAATANFPYHIYLFIRGFFRFPEATDEKTKHKMISLNGQAMLYGVARGIVAQATANFIYGKILLPSVNFIDLVKRKYERKEGE